MNINQFETLIWVARLGSFRAASRHLKMTQPAVSARIRELERELGVNLFDRTLRAVKLTPKGRELMEYAEQIVSLAALVQQQVGHDQAIAGRVRLGVTSIPARTWLPKLIRTINRSYPGVPVPFIAAVIEIDGGGVVRGTLRTKIPDDPVAEVGGRVRICIEDTGQRDASGRPLYSHVFRPLEAS